MARMICPYCGSTVEPTRDATGTLVCPACRNTGQVTAPSPAPPAAAPAFSSAPAAAGPGFASAPAPGAYPPRQETSGKAIAALVLGIASIVLWFTALITGLLAIIFGVMANRQIRTTPGLKGRGLAIAGIATGSVGLAITVLVALVFALVIGGNFSGIASAATPKVGFSTDAAGVGGTLTVTSVSRSIDWADLAVAGTASCFPPSGPVTVGDQLDCTSDGTVEITYVPTDRSVFSGSV